MHSGSGSSILGVEHCIYTTLSIARYAGIYRHAAGPCGFILEAVLVKHESAHLIC